MRSNGPEPLANRLGPLASEAGNVIPAAHSSDVKKKIGDRSPSSKAALYSRLGRPNDQNPSNELPALRECE